ncbi:YqgE/AlgH family protein [Salinisphaera sp. Q1T1-3]|uniref:YqgE/AlgH family protein n=1 Tax=Salinisphaera sp. Q1T1-3 TaxID=2321229 RepID=UPI000E74198D|nr:YqgE/AlgH family protein [Salinisphaera sp. Q1T1-3]RJS94814.1 YqgE/AlgH family protein [Salinisphaera sp. Q1T1-3]
MQSAQFKNQFLLAMPGQVEGDFSSSVTLLAEHNDDGAMGLVINKPSDLAFADMLSQLDIEAHVDRDMPVYWGGPVQTERGFVLHVDEGDWESSLHIDGGLAITTSRDILEAIGNGFGPSAYLITLGYAGWGAGQLESEMLANSWLTTPAESRIIFSSPAERRWADAAGLLGLEAHQLSGRAGHA